MNRTVFLLFLLHTLSLFSQVESKSPRSERPNVLFIMVDDLRPELGCYGTEEIKTPHIDQLAKESIQFQNAYCNIPVCGASRASLLTGILPTEKRFVQYNAVASEDVPNAKTLPQVFKEAGYSTYSLGKVFHDVHDSEENSWSLPAWRYQGEDYDFLLSKDTTTTKKLSKRGRGRFYELPDVADDVYNDGQTANKTITLLRAQKRQQKPFFIACGFVRPHLPFYAPKKYWDLYDREAIPKAENDYRPKNAPANLRGSGEFWSYHLDGLKPNSPEFKKIMKHGYYASVSYTDKLIGDVLQELKRLDLDKNTIVVLWGDHGWHLGEHSFWSKHNTMEKALRVPLLIKAPEVLKNQKSNAIVESIDIFPTLCELAKLPLPNQLQGKSFKQLLTAPEQTFRSYAYSRFLNADAVITKDFGYTHYSGKNEAVMLYDHRVDPEENENVAALPKYKDIVQQLELLVNQSKQKATTYNEN